jgi:uncharacterized protein (TIGR04141 family)
MAALGEIARLTVSVYLLKKSKTSEAQRALAAAGQTAFPLKEQIPGAEFISLPSLAEPPKWLDPISALLAGGVDPQLESQSPGALLWVPRGDKTFVFSFGYGHSKVNDDWVVPDFGKIVALAVVPQGQVREVRAEQVFAKRHIASERAPRASAVREFGFEPDRDLVSAVEGIPEASHWTLLGKKVRGGVSFRFDLNVDRLLDTLDHLAARFDSNDHLRRWPQASNLVGVRDTDRIEELDILLDAELVKAGAAASISLAAPSERSGEKPYPQHSSSAVWARHPSLRLTLRSPAGRAT